MKTTGALENIYFKQKYTEYLIIIKRNVAVED